ncbi:TadE/TadG family type IV pilus assembly protein [Yoonia sp.]|uniref:TadE/TadG family type IV pilus assembly protein n=1 Tax=Yoonia sp. TaxID=2212373 RepID=UPI003F6BF759
MTYLASYLRRFREDEEGVIAVELLLVVPMLVWALLSTLVYFDAYRTESINSRAGLTLADMISREQIPVDANYIDSMREVLRALTLADANPDIRITVFRYRQSDDTYRRVWSEDRGIGAALDNTDLNAIRDRLPIMADGSRSLLIETRTQYSAPFSIGLGPFTGTRLDDITFNSFTVITPRFLGSICFDPTPGLPSSGDEIC